MKQTWEKEKINRRTFFTKSAGYTAGLSLLVFLGPCWH